MDPLGVVASIVAILQLSAKVIGYLNDVKDASKDRATCAVEASNLHSLLTNLRFRLEDEDVATPWFTAIRALTVEHGPLDQFQDSLELLHHRMTGGKGRMGKITQALTWKFKKEEVDSILHSIERLKTMVAIALQMDHFKLSKAIKNDTDYVRGHLPRIQTAIETIHLEQERAALEDLRSWLSQTNPGAQQSDILRRRHKGTGQWFLDAPEFTAWLRGASSSGALFCTGIPGAGKTMIAALAIEHLATNVRSDIVGVAWAYCSYKSRNEQTVGALLATILQQLLQAANPPGVQVVEKLREKHTARGTMPHVDELLGTLQALVAELSTTFIVIDAMDECSASDGTRRQFLSHLRTLQINADARLMVTSRHVPEIVDDFKIATRLEIRAHTEDVEKFLAGQLARLPRCIQRDAVLQQLVQTKITEAIDGMFLLARLYVDSLLDKRTKSSVQSALAKLSQGSQMLEKAYEDAVQRLKSQLPEDADLAMRIITWIVHARKALTTRELRHALAVKFGESCLDLDNILETDDIVSVCAGLVTIDDQSKVVRLVHYTTHQYFEGVRENWSPRAQLEITRTCLTYLSYDEFHSGGCPYSVEFARRLKKYPLLGYAADYWGAHALSVQNDVADLACSICLNDNLVASMVQVESAYISGGRIHCKTGVITHLGLNVLVSLGLRDLAEEFLVRLGSDVEPWIAQKDHGGRTCLYVAAQYGHESTVQLLIDKGANVNTPGGELGSALCAAISAGHKGIVKLLLANGADIDALSDSSNSPLQLAFQEGNKDMFQLLLDHGANMSLANTGNPMPLVLASEEGWYDLIELLLNADVEASLDLDKIDSLGWTPLHVACFNGHIHVMELLLKRGANVNLVNKHGWSPIQIAADDGQLETVKMLNNHGADANIVGKSGETPLHLAALQGHPSVVQLLLDHGVLVDSTDVHGRTPLDASSFEGHIEVVRRLLQHGANVNSRDNEGWTPIHKAAYQGHIEIVQALLKKGADLHLANAAGCTPMCSASAFGQFDVVKLLLDHGADTGSLEKDGWTPLTIAACHGYEDIVELLLPHSKLDSIDSPHGPFEAVLTRGGHTDLLRLVHERQPSLHLTDPYGRTLVHIAIRNGHLDTYAFLTSIGLDPQAKDALGNNLLSFAASCGSLSVLDTALPLVPLPAACNDRWTPLHWACRSGSTTVIERLVQQGLVGTCVKVPGADRSWTPIDIAVFHGYKDVLDELSGSCKDALGHASTPEMSVGQALSDVLCDGCDHEIYGARFRCRTCPDFDFCFMCQPFLANLHPHDEWEYTDAVRRVYVAEKVTLNFEY